MRGRFLIVDSKISSSLGSLRKVNFPLALAVDPSSVMIGRAGELVSTRLNFDANAPHLSWHHF